jgi:hypothetical protein
MEAKKKARERQKEKLDGNGSSAAEAFNYRGFRPAAGRAWLWRRDQPANTGRSTASPLVSSNHAMRLG